MEIFKQGCILENNVVVQEAKTSKKVLFYIFDKILLVLLFIGINYYVEKEKFLDSTYREDANKAMTQYEKLWSLITKYESIKDQIIEYQKEYYFDPKSHTALLKKIDKNEEDAEKILREYDQCSKESINYLDERIVFRMNQYVQLLGPYYDIQMDFLSENVSDEQKKTKITLFENMKRLLQELKSPLKQMNIRMYINSSYRL